MAFFTLRNMNNYYKDLYPDLYDFIQKTNESIPNGVDKCIPHFQKLINSSFLSQFLNTEANKIASCFDYDNIQQDVSFELLALNNYTIGISKLTFSLLEESNRPELVSFSNDMILCNLGPGNLMVELYETAQKNNIIFDKNDKPIFKQKITLAPKDCISVKANLNIVKMVDMTEELLLISLASTESHGLMWHYDAKSLEPLYYSASNIQDSRIQNAISILLNTGDVESIPTLKTLAKSHRHFIRWDAIKAVIALDPKEGYELLLDAKNDPHPYVSFAANDTLENWSQIIAISN